MRKRLLSLVLASAMAVSMAGCGGNSDQTGSSTDSTTMVTSQTEETAKANTEQTRDAGEKIVIQYWTEDRHDMAFFEKKIEHFNQTNTSNIEVVLTTVTEDYPNMLAMSFSSGTAPDVAGIAGATTGFDLKTFVDAGIVLPVTERIKDAEFEKVNEASRLSVEGNTTIDGEVYWVPTAARSGSRMIYNKSILDEVGCTEYPKTIREVVELSKLITEKGGGSFYGIGATSSSPFGRWLEGAAERSGIYRYDYQNGRFDFSGYKEVVEIAGELFKDSSVFPGSPTQGVDAMRAQFTEGTFGIWANASQEAGVFTDQFPIDKFEWVVADLPSLDGETKGSLSMMTQKGYMMMSSSKHPGESWQVIQYFCSEEFLTEYLEGGYSLPLSTYMANKIDTSKTGRLSDFTLKDYEAIYPSLPAISLEGDTYLVVLWSAVMGEVSADEAIADLNTRYNAALDNDVKLGKIKRVVIKDFDPMKPNAGTVEYLSE